MGKQQLQKKIGKRVQKLRKEQGLTQVELGEAIGKAYTAIQKLEYGSVNPTIYFLRQVAGGMNLPLEKLLEEL